MAVTAVNDASDVETLCHSMMSPPAVKHRRRSEQRTLRPCFVDGH